MLAIDQEVLHNLILYDNELLGIVFEVNIV